MVKPFLAAALFTFSFLSTPCLVAGEHKCYFPNGELAANHFPCNSEAGGPCCDAGHACLDKNLCSGPKKEVLRGSCTDKTWVPNASGGICNRWCFGDQGAPGALLVRTADGNENETGASWRCDKTEVAGAQFYWMDWKVMETIAVFDSTQKRFNLLKPSSASRSPSASQTPSTESLGPTSSSPPQTTGAAPSRDASSTDNAATQRTATQTGAEASGTAETGTPAGTGSTSQPQPPTDEGLSTTAFAGIGAGIGVLVLIVVLLIFMLWRKRKARDEESTRAELDSSHDQGAARNEKGPVFELSTTPHHELYGSPPPAPLHPWNSAGWNCKELPTDFERMEMDAGYCAYAELSDGSSWTASQAETVHGSPQTTKSAV